MNRYLFGILFLVVIGCVTWYGFSSVENDAVSSDRALKIKREYRMDEKIVKTDAEWREHLTHHLFR